MAHSALALNVDAGYAPAFIMVLIEDNRQYYRHLDAEAERLAVDLCDDKLATANLLTLVADLYGSAKVEREFEDDWFESAYHSPITGQVEFVIARIAYHISQIEGRNWKVFLRRQVTGTAPDIRIQRGDKTLAVIEVKTKGGWIQAFFSGEKYDSQLQRFRNNQTTKDPDELIRTLRAQIDKYLAAFALEKDSLYYLLPTLTHVHRKRYESSFTDYHTYFSKTSGLPPQQLVLMSENLRLNLSGKMNGVDLAPTEAFETMIRTIRSIP